MGTASRARPSRSARHTPSSLALRSHRATSSAEIAVALRPGQPRLRMARDHGPPRRGGGQRVLAADGAGERPGDERGRGGVGVGVAQAGMAAGVDLGDDDGDGIPLERAVGLRLLGRHAVGGGAHVGDARVGGAHRRAAPSRGADGGGRGHACAGDGPAVDGRPQLRAARLGLSVEDAVGGGQVGQGLKQVVGPVGGTRAGLASADRRSRCGPGRCLRRAPRAWCR